jgi:hypothetical protein
MLLSTGPIREDIHDPESELPRIPFPRTSVNKARGRPDRPGPPARGCPYRRVLCAAQRVLGREGLGHRGGAKRRPRSGNGGRARPIVRPGAKPVRGGFFPGLKHQTLLYAASRVSASAIGAYTHDV